jgi:tetratricopeptide (TPR) repeat protein
MWYIYTKRREESLMRIAGALVLMAIVLYLAGGCASTNPHVTAGIIDLKNQNYEGAVEKFEHAVAMTPNDGLAHFYYGEALAMTGDLEKAIQEIERGLELDPALAKEVEKEKTFFWAIYNNAGMRAVKGQKFDLAVPWLEKAIKIEPDSAISYVHLARAYDGQGKVGPMAGAIAKALEADPDNVYANSEQASILMQQGDFEGALEKYNRVSELDSLFPRVHFNRGVCYLEVQQFQEAVEALEHEIKIASLLRVQDFKDLASLTTKLHDAQVPLSEYLREQLSPDVRKLLDEYPGSGAPSAALRDSLVHELNRLIQGPSLYDKERFEGIPLTDGTRILIEQNPQGIDLIRLNRSLLEEAFPNEIAEKQESEDIWFNLGSAYGGLSDWKNARQAFMRAGEINPGDVEIWTKLGRVMYLLKDYDGAEYAFTRAIDLDPNNIGAYEQRGFVRREKGDIKKSVEDLKRAQELREMLGGG